MLFVDPDGNDHIIYMYFITDDGVITKKKEFVAPIYYSKEDLPAVPWDAHYHLVEHVYVDLRTTVSDDERFNKRYLMKGEMASTLDVMSYQIQDLFHAEFEGFDVKFEDGINFYTTNGLGQRECSAQGTHAEFVVATNMLAAISGMAGALKGLTVKYNSKVLDGDNYNFIRAALEATGAILEPTAEVAGIVFPLVLPGEVAKDLEESYSIKLAPKQDGVVIKPKERMRVRETSFGNYYIRDHMDTLYFDLDGNLIMTDTAGNEIILQDSGDE